MSNEILYVLLPDYAEHEIVYLAQAIASDEYVHVQAVSDRNIVTANGSATLKFAKELLLLLENDSPERIEMYYQFNKLGFCNLFPSEGE